MTLVDGSQNGAHGIGAARIVGDEDAAIVGPLAALLVEEMGHVVARRGVDDRRVGRPARTGTGLSVARDGAVDEAGVHLRQLGIVKAQPLHHAGTVVLDQDVDGAGQLLDRGDRLGTLEVEHDGPFAGIELPEHRAGAIALHRTAAHQVALGRFDLDDVGAHVGEQPAAVGPGDRGREVEDPQAVERPRIGFSHLVTGL